MFSIVLDTVLHTFAVYFLFYSCTVCPFDIWFCVIQNRIYLQCLNEFHISHCRHEEPLLWTEQYLYDFFLTACLAPYILHIQEQINWSGFWVCLAHILYVINQWSGRKSSLYSFNRIIDTTYFLFWRVIALRMSSS